MSRLLEWMDREEVHLRTYIKAAQERVEKAEKEIESIKADRAEYEKDLAYLLRAKDVLETMVATEDPNGQIKMEGVR